MYLRLKNQQHLHPPEIFIFALFLVMVVTSTDYTEGPRHGFSSGIEYKIMCPYEGALTGINYRSTVSVGQIEFLCTSAEGNTTLGPYGGGGGKQRSIHCPPQHYISSFYGSNTTKLNSLGIRCRHESDMYNEGKLGGEFGEENGTIFDELALSIGARPVALAVYVRNNEEVDGIQVTYSNTSTADNFFRKGFFRKECNGVASHGNIITASRKYSIICPKDGVINMIEYSYGSFLHSIKFRCTSSLGETYHGPYGRTRGESRSLKCDENEHINYIKGKAGKYINELEIHCTTSGQSVPKFAQDTQAVGNLKIDRNGKVLEVEEENFNDECFSTRGRRPVEIKIYADDTGVYAILIKYENMPVAVNCKITHFEVLDGIRPKVEGYEVIGVVSGSSCSSLEQQLSLTLTQSFVQASASFSTSTTSDHSYDSIQYSHYGLTLGYWDKVLFYGGELNLSLDDEDSKNNEKTFSFKPSTSLTSAKSQKAAFNYQGPGAAIVIGYRTRYTMDEESVNVKYHYTCEGGSTKPTLGKVKVAGNNVEIIFGKEFKINRRIPIETAHESIHFQDFQFSFKNVSDCTSEVTDCISNIKLDTEIYLFTLFENELKSKFNNCLNRG